LKSTLCMRISLYPYFGFIIASGIRYVKAYYSILYEKIVNYSYLYIADTPFC